MMTVLPWLSCACVAAAVLLAVQNGPSVWDAVAQRYLASILPALRALSLDGAHIQRYLRFWGLALCVTASGLLLLGMYPLIPLALYLVYVAPKLILQSLIARRRSLLRDQMVGGTVALANTARAGLSLAQGLKSVAAESPQPLRSELERVVLQNQLGRTLADAINDTKESLQVDSFTLFAAAIRTCLERGGRITEALERLSRSLQENQRIERKLESETASSRKVIRILAVFPLFFLILFSIIYPAGTLELFKTNLGQAMLAGVGVLLYTSLRWSNKILNVDV